MYKLFAKIFHNRKTTIPLADLQMPADAELVQVKKELQAEIKRVFGRSLAIREVDAGSTASEEQELTALSNAFYDVERLGIQFVASPRHADMLMVTGPVSKNMKEALIKTYEATPDPKIVVAVGDDAIDGGNFKGSSEICHGVGQVIPVNYCIPGDPPSPTAIICALRQILKNL